MLKNNQTKQWKFLFNFGFSTLENWNHLFVRFIVRRMLVYHDGLALSVLLKQQYICEVLKMIVYSLFGLCGFNRVRI